MKNKDKIAETLIILNNNNNISSLETEIITEI